MTWKKPNTILFALLLFVQLGYAQNREIDSINAVLRNGKQDTGRIAKLNSIGQHFLKGNNYEPALQYATQALDLSKKLNYKVGELNALEIMSSVYAMTGKIAEARKLLFSMLPLNEALHAPRKTANNYLLLAKSFGIEEHYPEAIKYFYEALKRWEKIGDQEKIALCLTDIAFCYHNQGNPEECLKHVSKAATIYSKIGNKDGLARTYNFLAVIYMNQGRYEEALEKDSAVLKIYRELGNDVETFYVYQNIGNIHERIGDSIGSNNSAYGFYMKAEENYAMALLASEKGADSLLMAEAYSNLGRIYIKLKSFDKARNNLVRSIEVSPNYKSNLAAVYTSLATLDSAEGNYKQAYLNYRSSIKIRDSLSNAENTRKATQSRLQYEFDKKEASIKAEQELKDAEQLRIKNKQYFYMGLLGLTILVVLLVVYIQWKNNKQKKKANALLHEEKQKVEGALQELKSTQSQLIHSEKMASLGELTAGIAHEIQNPLNFVNNFSEICNELVEELKENLAAGRQEQVDEITGSIQQNLEKINYHGKRADMIVKGMLQHSRKNTGVKEPTNVNKLVDEYLLLSYHGLRAKDRSFAAIIETHFDPAISTIDVIPQEIGRVLLNLFNNSFYAVNERKKKENGLYEPVVQVSTHQLKNKVEIKVKDNGIGIPENILDKIFQPFFTTKPTGQGTGLGLSLGYDIITKGHDGKLYLNTKNGEGSEFIIQLPTQ